MPTSISIRLAIPVFLFTGIVLCFGSAFASPQDFQFDGNGKVIACVSSDQRELMIISYPGFAVLRRVKTNDLFGEKAWSRENDPESNFKFRQVVLHFDEAFIAFQGSGVGSNSRFSGIYNFKFDTATRLHFGAGPSYDFSPDGVWLVTSDICGNILAPFGALSGSQPVLPAEPRDGVGARSFYFSQDCKMIAECTYTYVDVQKLKATTEIQIFRSPDEDEVVKQVRSNAKVQLELVKQFRFEGHARDLRFSPDNKWLLWKGWPVADVYGNRPFMARIDADDSQVQEIKSEDEWKFWGDVCFAGTKSDYFILSQKTGEIDGKNRVSVWRKPLDLKTPAQLIVSKPGSCSYPIEVNNAGTHALVPIEITTGGGLGFYSDTEAASFGGSQIFLIDLANMKEVRGFPQDGKNVKFNPAKPTVVMRVGDRFSEYDLAGNPVANDELPTTPEARTKR